MNGTENEFGAPWGTMLKVMSTFGTVVLLAVPVAVLISMKQGKEAWVGVAIPAGCLVVLLLSLLFTVRNYTVSGSMLLVRRLLWSTRVDLSGLRSARVESNAMRGSIRTFGNGGLFSFSGRYRSRTLGSFRAFVTDLSGCVVLELDSGKVVVSPDNPEFFVALLRRGMI